MMLLDALEVTILIDPTDKEELSETVSNFSWDVIDFTKEFLLL